LGFLVFEDFGVMLYFFAASQWLFEDHCLIVAVLEAYD
jgi:hypothetical protein